MPQPPHPPLKRHVALQPLSRDHYVGLVQAQRLIESANGSEADRRKALGEFRQAWAIEISAHFADEDRLLPRFLPADAIERLRSEHQTLRSLAAEAEARASSVDPGTDWMRALGQTLNDHIRWEERQLFPLVEETAAADELRALADETARIEQARPRAASQASRRR